MIDIVLPIRLLFKRRITYLAIICVALCCFVVFVVMTVMNGLVGGFKEKIHQYEGDCIVHTKSLVGFPYYEDFIEILKQDNVVKAVSPVVHSFGFETRGGRRDGDPVQIMGVDPLYHSMATAFGDFLHWHAEDPNQAFVPLSDPNAIGCIPGVDMILYRSNLGTYNYDHAPLGLTFEVTCVPLNAKGGLDRAGMGKEFNTKTFVLSDAVNTGLPKPDQRQLILPLADAQWLCGMAGAIPRISALHLAFAEGVSVEAGTEQVRSLWQTYKAEQAGKPYLELLDKVRVEDWRSYRRATIGPMEKEHGAMIMMFLFVSVITTFIVFVVFYMIISHKVKDVGILRSVGLSQVRLLRLFMFFAVMVGMAGGVLGVTLGCLFLKKANALEDWLFEHFGFQVFDRTFFSIGDLPIQLEWPLMLSVGLAAVIVCVLGAAVPVIRAVRMRPVETLQVNAL